MFHRRTYFPSQMHHLPIIVWCTLDLFPVRVKSTGPSEPLVPSPFYKHSHIGQLGPRASAERHTNRSHEPTALLMPFTVHRPPARSRKKLVEASRTVLGGCCTVPVGVFELPLPRQHRVARGIVLAKPTTLRKKPFPPSISLHTGVVCV